MNDEIDLTGTITLNRKALAQLLGYFSERSNLSSSYAKTMAELAKEELCLWFLELEKDRECCLNCVWWGRDFWCYKLEDTFHPEEAKDNCEEFKRIKI